MQKHLRRRAMQQYLTVLVIIVKLYILDGCEVP